MHLCGVSTADDENFKVSQSLSQLACSETQEKSNLAVIVMIAHRLWAITGRQPVWLQIAPVDHYFTYIARRSISRSPSGRASSYNVIYAPTVDHRRRRRRQRSLRGRLQGPGPMWAFANQCGATVVYLAFVNTTRLWTRLHLYLSNNSTCKPWHSMQSNSIMGSMQADCVWIPLARIVFWHWNRRARQNNVFADCYSIKS